MDSTRTPSTPGSRSRGSPSPRRSQALQRFWPQMTAASPPVPSSSSTAVSSRGHRYDHDTTMPAQSRRKHMTSQVEHAIPFEDPSFYVHDPYPVFDRLQRED